MEAAGMQPRERGDLHRRERGVAHGRGHDPEPDGDPLGRRERGRRRRDPAGQEAVLPQPQLGEAGRLDARGRGRRATRARVPGARRCRCPSARSIADGGMGVVSAHATRARSRRRHPVGGLRPRGDGPRDPRLRGIGRPAARAGRSRRGDRRHPRAAARPAPHRLTATSPAARRRGTGRRSDRVRQRRGPDDAPRAVGDRPGAHPLHARRRRGEAGAVRVHEHARALQLCRELRGERVDRSLGDTVARGRAAVLGQAEVRVGVRSRAARHEHDPAVPASASSGSSAGWSPRHRTGSRRRGGARRPGRHPPGSRTSRRTRPNVDEHVEPADLCHHPPGQRRRARGGRDVVLHGHHVRPLPREHGRGRGRQQYVAVVVPGLVVCWPRTTRPVHRAGIVRRHTGVRRSALDKVDQAGRHPTIQHIFENLRPRRMTASASCSPMARPCSTTAAPAIRVLYLVQVSYCSYNRHHTCKIVSEV